MLSKEFNPDITAPHLPHYRIQRCVDTSFLWECRPLYLGPCRCPHFPTPQMFCLFWNTTASSVSHKQRPSSKNHRFPNPSEGGLRGELGGGVYADRLWIALVNLGVGCHWHSFKKIKRCFPWEGKLDERQMNFRSQTFEPSSHSDYLSLSITLKRYLVCFLPSFPSSHQLLFSPLQTIPIPPRFHIPIALTPSFTRSFHSSSTTCEYDHSKILWHFKKYLNNSEKTPDGSWDGGSRFPAFFLHHICNHLVIHKKK